MKESMLDVLIYLLEEYENDEESEREFLTNELVTAGFGSTEIGRAWGWLDELAEQMKSSNQITAFSKLHSTRVLSNFEKARLSTEAQSFLMELQNSVLIDTVTYELILDRLIALDSDTKELNMEQVRWVVLMVAFNRATQVNQFVALEHLIFSDLETCLQ